MKKVDIHKVKNLLDINGTGIAVTIYLPTHDVSTPPNIQQDQTRFKNLYERIYGRLEEVDGHNPFNHEFRQKCLELLSNFEFWKHQSKSLVVCAQQGVFEYFSLPIESDEYASIAKHFVLTPVIGLEPYLQSYYVLRLQEHKPKLFIGDAYALTAVDIGLPKDIESALNIDEMHQKSIQFASVSSSKGAEYHGHGAGKDTGNSEHRRFLKIIDQIIDKKLSRRKLLVLAGTPSEIADYKSICSYPNLSRKHITRQFTNNELGATHEQVQSIIHDELVVSRFNHLIADYKRFKGQENDLATSDTNQLIQAAMQGRIQTLLVGMQEKTRDTVRDSYRRMQKIIFPDREFAKYINEVARTVIRQSGDVVLIPKHMMPSQTIMASINRY